MTIYNFCLLSKQLPGTKVSIVLDFKNQDQYYFYILPPYPEGCQGGNWYVAKGEHQKILTFPTKLQALAFAALRKWEVVPNASESNI